MVSLSKQLITAIVYYFEKKINFMVRGLISVSWLNDAVPRLIGLVLRLEPAGLYQK
jgi:hypothetical protein